MGRKTGPENIFISFSKSVIAFHCDNIDPTFFGGPFQLFSIFNLNFEDIHKPWAPIVI